MADFENVAKQFVQFYYQKFDSSRAELVALYKADSMLTFESAAIQGAAGIVEKLNSLPFEKIEHQVATLDAQPANANGSIIVVVSGALLVEEERRPMSYVQTFQLNPDGAGSYYIFNDIFRLVYPAS